MSCIYYAPIKISSFIKYAFGDEYVIYLYPENGLKILYLSNKLTQDSAKPFVLLIAHNLYSTHSLAQCVSFASLLAAIGPSSCPSSPLTVVKTNPPNHSSCANLTSSGFSRAPAEQSQMEVSQEWLDIQAYLHVTHPESVTHSQDTVSSHGPSDNKNQQKVFVRVTCTAIVAFMTHYSDSMHHSATSLSQHNINDSQNVFLCHCRITFSTTYCFIFVSNRLGTSALGDHTYSG